MDALNVLIKYIEALLFKFVEAKLEINLLDISGPNIDT